jgi:hypothetical protein
VKMVNWRITFGEMANDWDCKHKQGMPPGQRKHPPIESSVTMDQQLSYSTPNSHSYACIDVVHIISNQGAHIRQPP